MTCGVYEFWCGPHFYQGSSKNIENRLEDHKKVLQRGLHGNPKVQAAYNKYGWTDAGVLVECEEHSRFVWEQAYIDTNWGDEKFLNLCHRAWGGGVRGRIISDETRAKHRERELGRKHSEERRRKNSEARKGLKQSPDTIEKRTAKLRGRAQRPEVVAERSLRMTGKKLSDEHRKALSDAHKGKTHSEETRAKMSATRTGKKLPPRSDEYRAKQSTLRKGKPSGYSPTPEVRARIAESNRITKARKKEERIAATNEKSIFDIFNILDLTDSGRLVAGCGAGPSPDRLT